MPTYEYVCTECENHWEEVQKISEPPVEVCPKCSKSTAKRQISGGTFILKGGGWYADLYSSKPKSAGKAEGGGDSAAATSKPASESKSESKGDAKSDSKAPSAAPPPSTSSK